MAVTPAQFLSTAVAHNAAGAIVAAADKFDISMAQLVEISGYSEVQIDAWFDSFGIDIQLYLDDGERDWGLDQVLALADVTQEEARQFLLDYRDHPQIIFDVVARYGASAEVVAEIVGVTPEEVTAYFHGAGFADYFAYFG